LRAGPGATLHFVLGAAVLILGMLAAIISMVGCAAVGSRFQARIVPGNHDEPFALRKMQHIRQDAHFL
jgi:hypothetical protein